MRRLWYWFLSWFRKTEALALTDDGERLDVYRPVKRLIFSYFNGQGMVQADPMTLYRKLVLQVVDLKKNLQAFYSAKTEPEAVTSYADLVSKVNQAFSIQSYEEGGLTSIETLACWDQFLRFVGLTGMSASTSLAKPQEEPVNEEAAKSKGEQFDDINELCKELQNPQPKPPATPSVPPTLAQTAEVSHDPPVVTIALDPEDAAVFTQGTADLPVLQRPDNGEGGSSVPVQETDGHRTGT